MYPNKTEIKEFVDIFYKSTNLGAICLDSNLNVIASSPGKSTIDMFICLEAGKITAFLTGKFSEIPDDNNLTHTFFLDDDLICNVSLVIQDNSYIGAYITQPAFIRKLNQNELNILLDRFGDSLKERSMVREVLLDVPVLSYDSIVASGILLSILSREPRREPVRQVLHIYEELEGKKEQFKLPPAENEEDNYGGDYWKHAHSFYMKLKETIKSGDTRYIQDIIDEIRTGFTLRYHSISEESLPALKRAFIQICTVAGFIAVEAGAPFQKTAGLADEYIRQADKLETNSAIFTLLKTALIAFTRSVSLNHAMAYSKPVRQVLDYITIHYREKITLDKLAGLTKLSTYYLSNLIKKETGVILAEHIRRIRVEHSKRLLLNTDMSILEITQEVGYNYQNHFSSVFKRQTGITPTVYKSMNKPDQITENNENIESDSIPAELELTYYLLSLINRTYDSARIVDPVSKRSWMISPKNELRPEPAALIDYWDKSNILASRASESNKVGFIIKEYGDGYLLIFAVAQKIGGKTYAIEVAKKITEQAFFHLKALCRENTQLLEEDVFIRDEQRNHYVQSSIIEQLTAHLHKNKEKKKTITIVLTIFEGEALNDSLLAELKIIICRSLRSDRDWIGHYIGNVFFIILDDIGEKAANTIKNRISLNTRITLEKMGLGNEIKVRFAVKTISNDITDPGAVIRMAFMALYSEIAV